MISMVVATDRNNAIGFKGHLPWGKSMKSDIRHYSELISDKTIVMGANTFAEPDHARSKANVVVLSRQRMELPEGVEQVHSLEEVLELGKSENDLMITGGGGVFHLMISHADKLYITVIDEDFEADVFFPEIDENEWEIISEEKHESDEDNLYDYTFRIYERKT